MDWPDIIKVGGGFVSGILTLWFAEAIRDRYKTRSDERAAVYARRKEIVDGLMPLIHGACAAASIYIATRGMRADECGQTSGAIGALAQCVALNKHYKPYGSTLHDPQFNEESVYDSETNQCPIRFKIDHEDWTAILADAGFKQIILQELSIPAFPPAFQRPENHLKQAWGHLALADKRRR